ncbi:hypothetical protein ACT4S2_13500 [Kocuria turfanensis]|uniref:hypothetical protein n=1 Tax=Kocuria turfanensis TaxID=388357 RepID=UPI0040359E3C
MPGEPETPVPADPAQNRPAQDRAPARRRPRRATGGTFSGAEPRLAGLAGPAPGTGDEPADEAHEDWLRAQRPPHWG